MAIAVRLKLLPACTTVEVGEMLGVTLMALGVGNHILAASALIGMMRLMAVATHSASGAQAVRKRCASGYVENLNSRHLLLYLNPVDTISST